MSTTLAPRTIDEMLAAAAENLTEQDVAAAQRTAGLMQRHTASEDMLQFNMFAEERRQ